MFLMNTVDTATADERNSGSTYVQLVRHGLKIDGRG